MLRRLSTQFKKNKSSETDGTSDPDKTAPTNGGLATINDSPDKSGTAEKPVNGDKGMSRFRRRKSDDGRTVPASDHSTGREEVESMFTQYAQLLHAARRPLPTQTGDGTYNEHSTPTGFGDDLKHLKVKGKPKGTHRVPDRLAHEWKIDGKTLMTRFQPKASGAQLVDDKTMIMERVIQLVAGLPPHSKNRVEMTDAFIGELWNTLEHPPSSYMGEKFMYRQPDGSFNVSILELDSALAKWWQNIMIPHLGAANTPYARSCKPTMAPPGGSPRPWTDL
jgi:hypothetical protein